MARRVNSLHHNLGSRNVVLHREHRSKKNRRHRSKTERERIIAFKRRKLEILTKELE